MLVGGRCAIAVAVVAGWAAHGMHSMDSMAGPSVPETPHCDQMAHPSCWVECAMTDEVSWQHCIPKHFAGVFALPYEPSSGADQPKCTEG